MGLALEFVNKEIKESVLFMDDLSVLLLLFACQSTVNIICNLQFTV